LNELWLIKKDAKGEWQTRDVGNIGDPAKIPLPVDMSITADDAQLWRRGCARPARLALTFPHHRLRQAAFAQLR
jgi:hypothetical protein